MNNTGKYQSSALLLHNPRVPGLIMSSGYCLCGVLHILPVTVWVLSCSPSTQKHARRWIAEFNLSLGVSEHVNVCTCALR